MVTTNYAADHAGVKDLEAPPLRWGVIGPGRIARHFAHAVLSHTRQRLVAVGSRSQLRAQTFANDFAIDRAYGSYGELVRDPHVDIVYIATPNSEHKAAALIAIAAGKHVLIEKPLGVDSTEASEIVAAARAAGVFAMEGLWSRFLPQTRAIERILADGVLGKVHLVTADFGEAFDAGAEASVFDPGMGGGALRDIGIYPVWLAHFVLGPPSSVIALGHTTATGVDGQVAMILSHTAGAQSLLATTMFSETASMASISGSRGRIDIASPFLMPGGFALTIDGHREPWRDESGIAGLDGLAWQAAMVAQHISDGLVESPLHPLRTSIEVLTTLDLARAQMLG